MGRKFNHGNTSQNQASLYTMAISDVNFLQVSPATRNISDIFSPTILKSTGAYSSVNFPPGNSTSLIFWPKDDHVENHIDRVMVAQWKFTVEQVITSILVHARCVSCRDNTRLSVNFLKCPYFKSLCRNFWTWVHCETLKFYQGHFLWCRR